MGGYLKNLKEITKGFKNLIWENKQVEEKAFIKAKICASCPLNVDGWCSTSKEGMAVKTFVYNEQMRFKNKTYKGCGCWLNSKIRSDSLCPIGNF